MKIKLGNFFAKSKHAIFAREKIKFSREASSLEIRKRI